MNLTNVIYENEKVEIRALEYGDILNLSDVVDDGQRILDINEYKRHIYSQWLEIVDVETGDVLYEFKPQPKDTTNQPKDWKTKALNSDFRTAAKIITESLTKTLTK